MKLILLFVLMTSTSIFAKRQHIECSNYNSWEHYILDIGDQKIVMGYVYALGTEDEFRFEKKVRFLAENAKYVAYQSEPSKTVETFTIAKEYIGKALNYFDVKINILRVQDGYKKEFSVGCHSSIID